MYYAALLFASIVCNAVFAGGAHHGPLQEAEALERDAENFRTMQEFSTEFFGNATAQLRGFGHDHARAAQIIRERGPESRTPETRAAFVESCYNFGDPALRQQRRERDRANTRVAYAIMIKINNQLETLITATRTLSESLEAQQLGFIFALDHWLLVPPQRELVIQMWGTTVDTLNSELPRTSLGTLTAAERTALIAVITEKIVGDPAHWNAFVNGPDGSSRGCMYFSSPTAPVYTSIEQPD